MNRGTIKKIGNRVVDVQLSGSAATLNNVSVSNEIDTTTLTIGDQVLVDLVNGRHIVVASLSGSPRNSISGSGLVNVTAGNVINNALLADGSVPLTGNLPVMPGVTIDGYDISVLGQTIDNLQAADSVARTGHTVLTHASHLVATVGPNDNQVLIRHAIFANKETLVVSDNQGNVEFMRIVGNPQPAVDARGVPCWRYTVTRRTATNPPGIVIGWAAATLVNGLTHRGYISIDARNNSIASPNLRFILHTDIDAGTTEQIVRLGNVRGILGNADDDYGFAVGRLTTGDRYFAYSHNRNLLTLRGADFAMSDATGNEAFRVWGEPEGDHEVGDTRLGKTSGGHLETSGNEVNFFSGSERVMTISPFGTRFRAMIWSGLQPGPSVGIGEENGQGLIAARNAAGTGQFVVRTGDENVHIHMGNSVEIGGYAQFAGGNFTTDGIIRARAFELLGGGTIGSGVVLTNAGKFTAGEGNNIAVIDGEDPLWRIYAGHAVPGDAPFRVNQAGALEATNANITGSVSATSGFVGGWTIATGHLYSGAGSSRTGLKPNTYPFYAGGEDPGTAPFRVTPEGLLTAANANITGTITAATGSIGGWTIASGHLYAGSGANRAGLQPASYPFYAGNETPASAPFRVTLAGALTATSGTVGGWTLNANSLTGGNATLHNSGYLTVGTDNDIARMDAADATYRLWIGHAAAASAPFRVTKAGVLTASNATITGTVNATAGNFTGSVYVGSANPRILLDGTNKRIESTNFASGTSGFRIEGDTGSAEFNNVNVRGAITSSIFSYNQIQASAGEIIVAKGAGKTKTDTVLGFGTRTITVEDPPGISHVAAGALWLVNDIIRLKDPAVADTWLKITTVTDSGTYWTLQAQFQSGGISGVILAGSAIVNYGQAGQGMVRISAFGANTPYVSIATHGGSPWSAMTERARLGNLGGISGTTGYGLWTNNGFFTGVVNAGEGLIGGWTISLDALTADNVGLSPADYPFYAGANKKDEAPFRVTADGNLVATNADITGTINASIGQIGSWTINGSYLAKDTGVNSTSSGMAPTDYPFYAGATYANRASAPFRVDPAGGLYATAGSVGGFTISYTEGLFSGTGSTRVQMKPGSGFWAGATARDDAPFRVTNAGALTATNVNITAGGGDVTLTSAGLRLNYSVSSTAHVAWYSGGTLKAYLAAFSDSGANTLRLNVQSSGVLDIAGTSLVNLSGKLLAKGDLVHQGANLGFFQPGTSGAGKQTVTGSRGGNAALASLLTALAAYGLITDSTTA